MDALEKPIESPEKGIGRPPKELFLESMTDPAEMVKLLNRTRHLTDDAFIDLLDDIGLKAARWVLRAKAIGGDTPALGLYLKIGREDAERRRQHKAPMRQLHASAFDQEGRPDRVSADAKDLAPATDVAAKVLEE